MQRGGEARVGHLCVVPLIARRLTARKVGEVHLARGGPQVGHRPRAPLAAEQALDLLGPLAQPIVGDGITEGLEAGDGDGRDVPG